MAVSDLLKGYSLRIREQRRANPDVAETALAPAFQRLLEGVLAELPARPALVVAPEYRNPGIGRPDIALVRQGAPARAFVELKAPAKPADPARWRGHDKRQYERLRELACWASCNFAELRLFHRAEPVVAVAIVPERCLRPDCDDAHADREIDAHDAEPFLLLVEMLAAGAGQEPTARDAKHLATLMAHSARLVRGIVEDRLVELREARSGRDPL